MKLKLISDGTNLGTKLIDEDTGESLKGISQIDFQASVADPVAEVTVKFFNIPVEIVSKANVDLLEYVKENDWRELVHTKSFEKEIKVTSQLAEHKAITAHSVKIVDNDSGTPVGAIQEIKWSATSAEIKAEIKKIKFDKKEWC